MSFGKSSANMTPLRAWRDADVARVAGIVRSACDEWARAWEVAFDAEILCKPAGSEFAGEKGWRTVGTRAAACAWMLWSAQADARLAASWFDSPATESPVVRDLIAACRTDLLQCLARALGLVPASAGEWPAASVFARWSGAVVASLPYGAVLLLDAGAVQPLVQASGPRRKQPGIVDIVHALGGAAFRLRVELQSCDLALGTLQSLQLGDVLRLPHRVDAPVTVVDERGAAVFRGWLARTRGRRALELAGLDPR